MRIHPLGTMNCCKQVSSQSIWKLSDTSIKAKHVYLLVALEGNSGDHFSIQDVSSADHERGYKPSWQSVRQLLRWFGLDQRGWVTAQSTNCDRHPSSHVSISHTAPSHGCKIKHLCKNQPPCWLISPVCILYLPSENVIAFLLSSFPLFHLLHACTSVFTSVFSDLLIESKSTSLFCRVITSA